MHGFCIITLAQRERRRNKRRNDDAISNKPLLNKRAARKLKCFFHTADVREIGQRRVDLPGGTFCFSRRRKICAYRPFHSLDCLRRKERVPILLLAPHLSTLHLLSQDTASTVFFSIVQQKSVLCLMESARDKKNSVFSAHYHYLQTAEKKKIPLFFLFITQAARRDCSIPFSSLEEKEEEQTKVMPTAFPNRSFKSSVLTSAARDLMMRRTFHLRTTDSVVSHCFP